MITLYQLNRAGFDSSVIVRYQSLEKVRIMIRDIENGAIMPDIEVYHPINGIYTISDGIHRICAYLYLGILTFKTNML